jgi:NADPH:quinone reductase
VEKHVLPLFERGDLTVPVAETFPLEQAADAYERFEAGGKLGKIVLVTN